MHRSIPTAMLALAFSSASYAAPATYTIDPTHTFVTFEAVHFGTSTLRGRFDRAKGSVSFDRDARQGTADILIDMSSVDTGTRALDTELAGPRFFDADRHPTAHFVGERMDFDGDEVAAVHGQLTMRDTTLPITLRATHFNCYPNPLFKREVCGGDFETTLKRSSFGMNFGIPDFSDDVHLLIQIEAIRR